MFFHRARMCIFTRFIIFNDKLAKSLNINIPLNNKNESAKILSGNFNIKI